MRAYTIIIGKQTYRQRASYYESLEGSFPYPIAYPISYWNRLFHIQLDLQLDMKGICSLHNQLDIQLGVLDMQIHRKMTLPGFRIIHMHTLELLDQLNRHIFYFQIIRLITKLNNQFWNSTSFFSNREYFSSKSPTIFKKN